MKKIKKKIMIVDYKLNNLFSIKNALDFLGYEAFISSDPDLLKKTDFVVLPGIGSFPEGMKKLHKLNLVNPLKNFISSGKKFMGICLGFQMLFQESSEFVNTKGLGVIKGKVKKLNGNKKFLRIPHIGWNKIEIMNNYKREVSFQKKYFYFVHSFYAIPNNKNEIFSLTKYENIKFCSSIKKNNIFACQFHPEKSGIAGLKLIKSFFGN